MALAEYILLIKQASKQVDKQKLVSQNYEETKPEI